MTDQQPTTPAPGPDAGMLAIAAGLLMGVRHAVLGCLDPDSGAPHLSRIALQTDADGVPVALLSGLAAHTRALRVDPRAGLLIAAPSGRGDPMTRARLSLQVRAEPAPSGPDPDRRARWLRANPKARIYIDLPDFAFWRMVPLSGLLNAGFGRAVALRPQDLRAMLEIPAGGDPAGVREAG